MTMSAETKKSTKIQPLAAIKALRALVRDPEDTAQVYTIVHALSGKSHLRTTEQFRQSPAGAKMLEEKKELLNTLMDREALSKLPAGSFGRAYLDFLARENISPEGLIEAGDHVRDEEEADTDEGFVGRRLRDMHDSWHVLTGYGRDGFGELCVLSFSNGQNWNPGFAAIIGIGILNISKGASLFKVIAATREAYRHGKLAKWLLEEDFEALFPLPLHEVRAKLNIKDPLIYKSAYDIIEATRPENRDQLATA